jgi:hypothetical protein
MLSRALASGIRLCKDDQPLCVHVRSEMKASIFGKD